MRCQMGISPGIMRRHLQPGGWTAGNKGGNSLGSLSVAMPRRVKAPAPLVTLVSSKCLHRFTQSFLNCFVIMAYRKGLQQEFSGKMNTVKILACSKEISCNPNIAVMEKKAMGDQHRKSVNTNKAILLAILESFVFHACDPRMAQYIFR